MDTGCEGGREISENLSRGPASAKALGEDKTGKFKKRRRKGLGPVRQLDCEGSAGEYEEVKPGMNRVRRTRSHLLREVCPWEDTTLAVWAGRSQPSA